MKRKKQPRKYNVVWSLAGLYLAYLGCELLYGLIRGTEVSHPALSVIAGVAFLAVGGAVVLREWRLYRGTRQEDAEADAPEESIEEDGEYEALEEEGKGAEQTEDAE